MDEMDRQRQREMGNLGRMTQRQILTNCFPWVTIVYCINFWWSDQT